MTNKVKAEGLVPDRKNCWEYFIKLIRKNLHVVLAFSPVGDDFRNRAKKFPALVNCTVIGKRRQPISMALGHDNYFICTRTTLRPHSFVVHISWLVSSATLYSALSFLSSASAIIPSFREHVFYKSCPLAKTTTMTTLIIVNVFNTRDGSWMPVISQIGSNPGHGMRYSASGGNFSQRWSWVLTEFARRSRGFSRCLSKWSTQRQRLSRTQSAGV